MTRDPLAAEGTLDSLKGPSPTSPSVATIDSRSVNLFGAHGVWNAAWWDGHFVVEVQAHDELTASTRAKAVLDAY